MLSGEAISLATVKGIRHIFVAPSRGAPMLSVASVEAVADVGLWGDRYFDAAVRRGPDYQVSLIELENIEAFAQETGLSLLPDAPRRNIVTSGVRLNDLCGLRFTAGAVEMQGLELCEPCSLFAKRTHKIALSYFRRRGGLRARIISTGVIRVGDEVARLPNESPERSHDA